MTTTATGRGRGSLERMAIIHVDNKYLLLMDYVNDSVGEKKI